MTSFDEPPEQRQLHQQAQQMQDQNQVVAPTTREKTKTECHHTVHGHTSLFTSSPRLRPVPNHNESTLEEKENSRDSKGKPFRNMNGAETAPAVAANSITHFDRSSNAMAAAQGAPTAGVYAGCHVATGNFSSHQQDTIIPDVSSSGEDDDEENENSFLPVLPKPTRDGVQPIRTVKSQYFGSDEYYPPVHKRRKRVAYKSLRDSQKQSMSQFEYLRERDRNASNLMTAYCNPEEKEELERVCKVDEERQQAQPEAWKKQMKAWRSATQQQQANNLDAKRQGSAVRAGYPSNKVTVPFYPPPPPPPIPRYPMVMPNGMMVPPYPLHPTNKFPSHFMNNPSMNTSMSLNMNMQAAGMMQRAGTIIPQNNNNKDKHVKKKRIEIYRGPPTGTLDGHDQWPHGWVQLIMERQINGASGGVTGKRTRDSYWFSPLKKYKFDSKVKVQKFLKALEQSNGNEQAANNIWDTIVLK